MAKQKQGKWAALLAGKPKYQEDADNPNARAQIDEIKKQFLTPTANLEAVTLAFGNVEKLTDAIEDRLAELRLTVLATVNGQNTANALARAYDTLKDAVEFIESKSKEFGRMKSALTELLDDAYEREDITNLKFSDGSAVRVEVTCYASVKDKAAFRKWCIDNGYENELTLHPGTMASVTKELIEQGHTAPEGVDVFIKPKVVRTKGE